MKRFLTLSLLLIVSISVLAQANDLQKIMQNRNEFYFSFEIDELQELGKIANSISIDKLDGNTVVAYANHKQYEKFLSLGYETTLLTPPSMLEEHAMYDGRTRAEYDWDEYPTYEAYVAMMEEFAAEYPDKCTLIELGTLNSGRKVLLVRINNGVTEGKPKFLYGSTIHGDETTGYIMMLRLIDLLLTREDLPEVQNIIENLDLFVCPNANPDGTYHGGNHTVNGATRSNAYGVDMNRNYPDPVDGPHPDGEEYALETQWFMQFAEDYQITMSAHYHGGAEVMNYPWDNNYELHADDSWWQMVSREYADLCQEQNSSYMTDLNNGITNGAQWYRIGGGRQDYMNYYMGCREVTIECSVVKCPSPSDLPSFWDYNYNSIFAYMNQALCGIHGTVVDAATNQPIEATIELAGHDHDYSKVSTQLPAGDFHRPIDAGTYSVLVTANGYVPQQFELTVVDGQPTILNVELEVGEGLLPEFNASLTEVSLGGSVQFTDNTWGANLVSWNWTFEGGNPATSTEQNPLVTYEEEGTFDVTLTVSNADGDTETITKADYITVLEYYNMTDGTVTTCDALFYDSGGPTSNYSDQSSLVMTFLPATEGAMIQVEFLEFATEEGYDVLRIYDGTSTAAQSIAELDGNVSSETYTATNAEGALTFSFSSDFSVSMSGWKAIIRCVGGEMNVEAEISADTICLGEQVELQAVVTGGLGEYTYSWEPADIVDEPNSAVTMAMPTELGNNVFTVTVSDGTNTKEAEVSVFVVNCENVEEQTLEGVTVYPNPAKDMIYINVEQDYDVLQCKLYNIQGQLVRSYQAEAENGSVNVENISSGIYYLDIDIDGKHIVKKIVVE